MILTNGLKIMDTKKVNKMSHYKDQFALPPEPLNIEYDVIIKMIKHCFSSNSASMKVNSALNLLKLSGGYISLKGDSYINIYGKSRMNEDDYNKIKECIKDNILTAVRILKNPNIFDYEGEK